MSQTKPYIKVPCGVCCEEFRVDTLRPLGLYSDLIRLAVLEGKIVASVVLSADGGGLRDLADTEFRDAVCAQCAIKRVARDAREGRRPGDHWRLRV